MDCYSTIVPETLTCDGLGGKVEVNALAFAIMPAFQMQGQ